MKNLIFVTVIAIFTIVNLNAQSISKNALGVRLGDNDGFGGEISYQLAMSKSNRLELDLGFRNHKEYDAFKLSGLYQWVWKIENQFNWYAGVGAGIGSWSAGDYYTGTSSDGLFINADGIIGIEYDFNIPLMLSLDFRPEFGIVGDYGKNTNFDIALALRYQF